MTTREVTEKLGIRQFLQLCGTVDTVYGKKKKAVSVNTTLGAGGKAGAAVIEYSEQAIFEVTGIRRYGQAQSEVDVKVGKETMTVVWSNLLQMPKIEFKQRKLSEPAQVVAIR